MRKIGMCLVGRLLVSAALCACISACAPRQSSYSTLGTLYVEYRMPKDTPTVTTEIENGQVVGHRPAGLVVARDYPKRSFVAANAAICTYLGQPGAYILSPDGTRGLCSSVSDNYLRLFDPAHPKIYRILLNEFFQNADGTSFAWLDNHRFIATVLDKSCPYAHLYDFFPTRVVTFDLKGRRLSQGPCAFGVVAGQHRLALVGERPNDFLWHTHQLLADDPAYYNDGYDRFHPTWSVDGGETWHDGSPLAFDGNDSLLYLEQFSRIVRSENGQTVLRNAYDVQWSR
jgi:WD40 repeat protein